MKNTYDLDIINTIIITDGQPTDEKIVSDHRVNNSGILGIKITHLPTRIEITSPGSVYTSWEQQIYSNLIHLYRALTNTKIIKFMLVDSLIKSGFRELEDSNYNKSYEIDVSAQYTNYLRRKYGNVKININRYTSSLIDEIA